MTGWGIYVFENARRRLAGEKSVRAWQCVALNTNGRATIHGFSLGGCHRHARTPSLIESPPSPRATRARRPGSLKITSSCVSTGCFTVTLTAARRPRRHATARCVAVIAPVRRHPSRQPAAAAVGEIWRGKQGINLSRNLCTSLHRIRGDTMLAQNLHSQFSCTRIAHGFLPATSHKSTDSACKH